MARQGAGRSGGACDRRGARGVDEAVVHNLAGVPQAVPHFGQHQAEGLRHGDDAVELPVVLALALLRQGIRVGRLLGMDLARQILECTCGRR